MKYIIYFEPMDIEAESTEDAIRYYNYIRVLPDIIKVIPAKFTFDNARIRPKQPDV